MKNQMEATKAADYKVMKISSTAFSKNAALPKSYTYDGDNINPPLDINQIPRETKSLAIIMEENDISGKTSVHWVTWNIPVTHHIRQHEIKGVQGLNDFGNHSYHGPLQSKKLHDYIIKVFALDSILDLPADTTGQELESAMSDKVIGFGEIIVKPGII